jgi:hypothetical protein
MRTSQRTQQQPECDSCTTVWLTYSTMCRENIVHLELSKGFRLKCVMYAA